MLSAVLAAECWHIYWVVDGIYWLVPFSISPIIFGSMSIQMIIRSYSEQSIPISIYAFFLCVWKQKYAFIIIPRKMCHFV